jgi:hypothetical protein
VLGHLTYIVTLVIREFIVGEANPLAHWEETFDGADASGEASQFPPWETALAQCRETREATLARLESVTEDDLDAGGAKVPQGFERLFGTRRRCFQFVAHYGYMHRGHLADARRAAGLERMWV